MDPREDHLPDPFPRNGLNLSEDLSGSSAPDPAPRVRNDAVCAELIAAVLDLYKSPGVARILELHILVFRPVGEIRHGPAFERASRKAR